MTVGTSKARFIAIKSVLIGDFVHNGRSCAIAFWLDGPRHCCILVYRARNRFDRRFPQGSPSRTPCTGRWFAIIIVGYVFVLHEQLAVHPWIASPHPLWHEAAEALGVPLAPSVSIARNQPFFALGAPLANMLAILCSFIVCIDRDRARQLLLTVAWSGAAYALYGIVAYLIDPNFVLWREKIAYNDVLTSTFINRNTAAVYFGSCSILWLLFVLQQLRRSLPLGSIRWSSIPHQLPANVQCRSASALCDAAPLPSGNADDQFASRRGDITHGAHNCLSPGYLHRDLPRRGGIAATLVIGGLIAILFLQVLGGNVSGRFDAQGLSDEGRLETYRSTIRMIADHPWFGTGMGTFAWSFPAYRSADALNVGRLGSRPQHSLGARRRTWAAPDRIDYSGLADCPLGPDPRGTYPPPRPHRTRRGPCDRPSGDYAFSHRLFTANIRLCNPCICTGRCRTSTVFSKYKKAARGC